MKNSENQVFGYAILDGEICCKCYRKTLQDPENFSAGGAEPLYAKDLEAPGEEFCLFCHEELAPESQ